MLPNFTYLASVLAFSGLAYGVPSPTQVGISADPTPDDFKDYACDSPGAKWAEISNIKKGAEYLYTRSDKARISKGPDHCDRVSCSWNSAIFLCNEDTVAKVLEWKQLGDATELLLVKCGDNGVVKGQVNFNDKWNIVVKNDVC
ncbi:hypothetical protein QBC40DRAFT_263750 [Triangularia verruculosa]|uniref:Uncharacterized protein n=1 Tax=Triangularia verruculosa TaxID=2587418 RepID=A0AAN7AXG6_9PEZI|nr:hypothetical protein QBC40DRAFT_263750 [Triangularia verruculosa]